MGYFNELTKPYEDRQALRSKDGDPSAGRRHWEDFCSRLSKEQQLCPECNGSSRMLGEAPCEQCRGYGALDLAGKPSRVFP